MIVPDLNLLIYAYDSNSSYHAKAKGWWVRALSGSETVGISWIVVFGFIRIWTNARVFANPMTVDQACSHVEAWLARPMVKVLTPGPRHTEILFRLLRAEGGGGNLTTDAHLAALAIETSASLHSNDSDFLRFPGLRWLNPIE